MDKVREKIKKLLALGESPNENEAREALLRARALMAQHKLCAEDVEDEPLVISETVEVFCSPEKDAWAVELSAIIAEHYCCGSFRRRRQGDEVEIGFIALDCDFDLCRDIFRYAYDCVKSSCESLSYQERKKGRSEQIIKRDCNSYAMGFCYGLQTAYERQDKEHRDWALVLSTPKPVSDVMNDMKQAKEPFLKQEPKAKDLQFLSKGFLDGLRFDPGRRLPEGAVLAAIPGFHEA
ncbi:MAG: DUF2786 domain-containing protein [Oscillospiraceae bacterium]|nr:DUF2786 domain-containing protein [Oscillospiraceae bacterium]